MNTEASVRSAPPTRNDFRVFRSISTRWRDNDVYGHVNNVVFYEWFDSAVNAQLIDAGALDPHTGDVVGYVVETQCAYFAPLAYPQIVEVGLAVTRVGRSSLQYALGAFAAGASTAAAAGRFVHVYVERATQRPVAVPSPVLRAIAPLIIEATQHG